MKYGLIGEKLTHSFSAEIHPQLFGYEYGLKELSAEELPNFLERREFSAINVTIPYKETVIPHLDEVDATALEIGAVNTIVNRDGKLYGYNTDFAGLCALLQYSGISVTDKKVLILGSGGTSKTAVAVAEHLNCRQAFRVSRSATDGCITYAQAAENHSDAQIVINTTPCGMYPRLGECAVNLADYPHLEGVVDVVFNPLRTQLVCEARRRGIPAVGGLYMLVAQAAAAAERFVDKVVDPEKVEEIYLRLLKEKQNVVLIGMPGCGKSTVGRLLAEQMGFAFVDTDHEIVARDGRTISDIFADDGEEGFRHLETAVIQDVSAAQHTVIATGGGAVLKDFNVDCLKQNGRLYFLDRSLDLLVATADRPLSSHRAALEQRYRERYRRYCAESDCRIVADDTVEEVVNRIREDWLR